ncbi:MAG: helix-turn-helix domain-containing protein [Oscillospiraceae bacterium]|jgi:AraC-like DNA-binding protein/predicted transcriptional regulator YdeE|nr:helix-turn-helix domain-containing protein [Oscillospiraceae bacterium]
MQKSGYIKTLTTSIERDLTAELSPDTIARRNFLSVSQLYRDFYAYTGHSIKEYIRKRRISNACEKLRCSDTPLAIIAEESGCRTQQAFCKLFKSIVGLTPMEYKQSDSYYYFYPFPADEISLAVKVGTETIPECTTQRFYDSCLLGIEDKAIAALGEINGRVFGRNGKQIGSRLCYEVMLGTDTPGSAATYATCTVNYKEQDINDGWNYLYNIWLPGSMFEQSDSGYFEEYLFRNGKNPHGGKPYKLKLYLPVKKRRAAQHFRILQEPEKAFVAARASGHNAEHKASKAVMDFLQAHYPLLIRNARHFYVSVSGGTYTCGVECGGEFSLPAESGLEILHLPTGQYAVLPDDCLGDIRVGADKITRWLQNNSIQHKDEPIFAVYEAPNGHYDTDSVRMMLYKKLKDDKNG